MANEINLPEWHNPGIEPPQRVKQNGWVAAEKPAYQYMNWQFNRTYESLLAFKNSQDSFGRQVTTSMNLLGREIIDVGNNLTDTEQRFTEQLAQVDENFKANKTSATLGNELIVNAGNWIVGAGWSGNNTDGFTHTTGNVATLEYPITTATGEYYEVDLTVDDPTNNITSGWNFWVTIGGSEKFEMYQGTDNPMTYKRGIKTLANGNLVIEPSTSFTGKIKNISVRQIIGELEPTFVVRDNYTNPVLTGTITDDSQSNVFLGKNNAKRNTSGHGNAVVGYNALRDNTSGYWNSAIGLNALRDNTVGSRNLALAYNALLNNISGHRNIALGTFALNRNTHGANNIAIGADALWYNTVGNRNIAIGTISQEYNVSGVGNVSVGYEALQKNELNHYAIAIGYQTLKNNKTDETVAIGYQALLNNTTGAGNVAIGSLSLKANLTGINNTAIGIWSGSSVTGNNNVLIGRYAGGTLANGSNNILIGANTTAPANDSNWHLNIGNVLRGDISSKKFGIDVANPSAYFHLRAGTAGTPPLKLTAGTLTTVKQGGSFEYDGTTLYFTTDDGLRHPVTLGAGM